MKIEYKNDVKFSKFFVVLLLTSLFYFTGCTEKVVIQEKLIQGPAQATAQTLFFDDFSAASQSTTRNMWLSNGKAHWVWQGRTSASQGCTDGCLKQNSEDDRALNAIMYVSTPKIADATIETKTRINYDIPIAPTSEELKKLRYFIGTGIVFRLVDANNFYMFRLAGEEGCVLGKMINNEWYDLQNPRRLNLLEGGRIKPNTWYNLKVQIRGNNIQCFINNSPVINYTDHEATFTVGSFGLTTFKCFADFEYISVTN